MCIRTSLGSTWTSWWRRRRAATTGAPCSDSSPKHIMDTMAGADETKTGGHHLGEVIYPQPRKWTKSLSEDSPHSTTRHTASRTYISYFGMHKSWNKFVLNHKNISAGNPQQIQICHKNQSNLPQKPIKFATKTNQKEQFDDLGLILIIEFITFKFYHISPPSSC